MCAQPGNSYDAVVVGAGPNGLAAAIELARNNKSVAVFEACATVGGGCRSGALTRKRYIHDHCSTVHALADASPFMRSLPLERYGVEMVRPDAPLAHPLDGGTAVILERSIDRTALTLGPDGDAYRSLFVPLERRWEDLLDDILRPVRIPRHLPLMARFARGALSPAESLARRRFKSSRARALVAGIAAHTMVPLDRRPTGALALVLGLLAHVTGWPVVKGGSQVLADALADHLRFLGGEIFTETTVESIDDLPRSRAYLFDLGPAQVARIASSRLTAGYLRRLGRFRYGPGVFKLDLAIDGPIPWNADECGRAGTVHIGGSFEEIVAAEAAVAAGRHPERPFILLVQPSLFDPTRAPKGKHTVWAYCHVPAASPLDLTKRIEDQIERFAHGFKDRIIARHTTTAVQMEAYNANYVGGDINGGIQDMRQMFARPVARWDPYSTPNKSIYMCSSSTPPGGGVHGMSGYLAAHSALRRAFR